MNAGRVTKAFMIMHVMVNRTLTAVLETTFKTAETYLATALDAHDTAWFIKSVRGYQLAVELLEYINDKDLVDHINHKKKHNKEPTTEKYKKITGERPCI